MLDEVEKDVTVIKNTINTIDKVTLPPLLMDQLYRPKQILHVLSLPPTLLSFLTKSSIFIETKRGVVVDLIDPLIVGLALYL
jgi:hypothetical protein